MAVKTFKEEEFFTKDVIVAGGVGSGVVGAGIPTDKEYPAKAGEFNDIIFHIMEFVRSKATKQEIIEALGATYDPADPDQLKNELSKAMGKGIISKSGVPTAGDFIAPIVAIVDSNTGIIYTKKDDGSIAIAGGKKATATEQGIIEIATDDEVQLGIDTERAITPNLLKSRLESYHSTAPTANNDESKGNYVGEIWVDTNTTPRTSYVCIDNSNGTAKWFNLNQGGTYIYANSGDYLSEEITLNKNESHKFILKPRYQSENWGLIDGRIVVPITGVYEIFINAQSAIASENNVQIWWHNVTSGVSIEGLTYTPGQSLGLSKFVRLERGDEIEISVKNGTDSTYTYVIWEVITDIRLKLLSQEQ